MYFIHEELPKKLFNNEPSEFKKPSGYKNISSTEMKVPVEKKNQFYCSIS